MISSFIEMKISYDDIPLNLSDKVFTLFIKKESRVEPDYANPTEFKNFGSPIVKKKSSRANATNTEVAVRLQEIGIDIFKSPLAAEFKNTDGQVLTNLFFYLVASINETKKPSFTEKQRLANSILAIMINYIALGEFGRNVSGRYKGLLTGQLIESLRGEMSD